ncbi:delta-like protein C isoform X8 [Dreissena polymorpha]|uniref:delta-like protein C isoform X8 n=1 Tax=Dreissena polymorpha TaxID=45954 RepID=UPI0022645091|nr:delta-like protein C isoform X8 [Dreissena polymorpha]
MTEMGPFGLILVLNGLIGVSFAEECVRSGDCHITTCTHGEELRCNNRTCVCIPHPCASHPCQNHGVCVEHHGTYECKCPVGVSGTNCEVQSLSTPHTTHHPTTTRAPASHATTAVPHPCASHPCQNHGVCVEHHGTYECKCPVGVSGTNCEVQSLSTPHTTHHPTTTRAPASHATTAVPHPCASHPCQNHGVCVEHHGTYQCKCPVGVNGTNCEVQSLSTPHTTHHPTTTRAPASHATTAVPHPCASHPCQNHGVCVEHHGTYHCNCTHGFSGTDCEDNKFCLACDDAVSPHTCDKITICGSHEICYVDSYVTSVGSLRFNLG